MTETQLTPNPFELIGRIFGESGEARASLARQAEGFWQAQAQILEGMESLSRAWFQRRQQGTSEALAAAKAMSGSTNVAEAMQAYQRWLQGSFERLTADGVEAQAQFLKLSQAWIDGMRSVAIATAEAVDARVKSAAAEAERAAESALKAERRAA
jgi:hypothetical protein